MPDEEPATRRFVGRFDTENFPQIISTVKINDNGFHHIAFVKDGSTLFLYIDGVLDGSTDDTTNRITINNTDIFVGTRAGNSLFFQGSIDPLLILPFRPKKEIL